MLLHAIFLLSAYLLLLIYSFTEKGFFVSRACLHAFFWPFMAACALLTMSLLLHMRPSKTERESENLVTTGKCVLVKGILVPVVSFLVFYVAYARNLPQAINAFIGTPYKARFPVETAYRDHGMYCYRWLCPNHITLFKFDDVPMHTVCLDDEEASGVEAGSYLSVIGKRSWFGTSIERVDTPAQKNAMEVINPPDPVGREDQ